MLITEINVIDMKKKKRISTGTKTKITPRFCILPPPQYNLVESNPALRKTTLSQWVLQGTESMINHPNSENIYLER